MPASRLVATDPADRPAGYDRPDSPLELWFSTTPYLPRCSADKTAGPPRPRRIAVRQPYIQANRSDFVHWLVFDIDAPLMVDTWEHAYPGLPCPNLIVQNPANGHAHFWYRIQEVYTGPNARQAPIRYMKALYEGLRVALKADASYQNGFMAQTPGHPYWRTQELHMRICELNTLRMFVDPITPRGNSASDADDDAEASTGRNCHLFCTSRRYAYGELAEVRGQSGTYEDFAARVLAFAIAHNQYGAMGHADGDLPRREVEEIARSIARWVWHKYRARRRHGTMEFPADTPIAERQTRSALRTNGVKRSKTAALIREHLPALSAMGAVPTIACIARATGLSRQAVARHRTLFAAPTRSRSDVTYALHQVTNGVDPDHDVPTTIVSASEVSQQHPYDASGDFASEMGEIAKTTFTNPAVTGVPAPLPGAHDRERLGEGDAVAASHASDECSRLRTMSSTRVLNALLVCGFTWKFDQDFHPRKNQRTQRLQIQSERRAWTIVMTGLRWFDVISRDGGHGAFDLVMHLTGWPFSRAKVFLSELASGGNRPTHVARTEQGWRPVGAVVISLMERFIRNNIVR